MDGLQTFVHSIGIIYDINGKAVGKHATGHIKMEDSVKGMIITSNINYEVSTGDPGFLFPIEDGCFSFIDECKFAVKGSKYKMEVRGADIPRWSKVMDEYGYDTDALAVSVAVFDLYSSAIIPLSFNHSIILGVSS